MRSRIASLFVLPLAAALAAGCDRCDRKPPAPTPVPDHAPTPTPTPPPTPTTGTESRVIPRVKDGQSVDPVCGMTIPVAAETLSHDYRGVRYYFCSANCAERFRGAPTTFPTGQPGESCVCQTGGMDSCRCTHCAGRGELCDCWSRGIGDGHEDHDH